MREEEVKEKLREWLKSTRKHSDWFIAPTSIRKPLAPYNQRMLSPDIDVLAYYKDSNNSGKLVAFETKAPLQRFKTDYKAFNEKGEQIIYDLYKNDYIRNLQKEDKIATGRAIAGLKYSLIYEGIGQALFHLRWADQSFLVLPPLSCFHLIDPFQEVILHVLYEKFSSIDLSIGLIKYDYHFEKDQIDGFEYVHKAKNSCLWQQPSAKFPLGSNKLLYCQEIRELRENLKERCLSRKMTPKSPE